MNSSHSTFDHSVNTGNSGGAILDEARSPSAHAVPSPPQPAWTFVLFECLLLAAVIWFLYGIIDAPLPWPLSIHYEMPYLYTLADASVPLEFKPLLSWAKVVSMLPIKLFWTSVREWSGRFSTIVKELTAKRRVSRAPHLRR
jgi:hypothetical protein